MRLIDADALMREFAGFVRKSNNSDFADVPTWNDAVSLLGSAPTIEAEPLRHGHWLYTDAWPHRVYCSVCYRTYALKHWQIWEDGSLARAYCPNCGAKMDGGMSSDDIEKEKE